MQVSGDYSGAMPPDPALASRGPEKSPQGHVDSAQQVVAAEVMPGAGRPSSARITRTPVPEGLGAAGLHVLHPVRMGNRDLVFPPAETTQKMAKYVKKWN